jgi:hypothetical protein
MGRSLSFGAAKRLVQIGVSTMARKGKSARCQGNYCGRHEGESGGKRKTFSFQHVEVQLVISLGREEREWKRWNGLECR